MDLIGGGESILTLPIVLYLLAVNPILATAYSLFTVGATLAISTIQNLRNGLVDLKTAVVCAIPVFISV